MIAFIYGDLIVLPLIVAYKKYYGAKAAAYITGILFASMVGAGIIVDLLFTALGITGESTRPEPAMSHASFQWNYTTWFDIIAILAGGFFVYLHFRKSGSGNEDTGGHEAHAA